MSYLWIMRILGECSSSGSCRMIRTDLEQRSKKRQANIWPDAFLIFQEAAVGSDGDDAQGDRFAAGGEGLTQGVF